MPSRTARLVAFAVLCGTGRSGHAADTGIDTGVVGDEPPVVEVNGPLQVDEGATAPLTAAILRAADAEDGPSALVWTLVADPQHGTLHVTDAPITNGGTFTQRQIDDGQVSYAHDGSETTEDHLDLKLADSADNAAGVSVEIAIAPVDDPPVVVRNEGVRVGEGDTVPIGDDVLRADDPDDTALAYDLIVLPARGTLVRDGDVLGPDDGFTQADLDAGLLSYEHDGSDTTSDAFAFVVSDGLLSAPAEAFSIVVAPENDAPRLIVTGPLPVVEGGSVIVGPGALSCEDPDDSPASLEFTVVTAPTGGVLRRFGAPLAADSTFTQADVDALVISYTHGGGEAPTDAFSVGLSDGATAVAPQTLDIAIEARGDAPVAVDDGPYHVDQDAVLVVDAASGVLANDLARDAGTLTVTPGHGVVNGTLDLAPDGSFTYTPHAGFVGADRFTYSVGDGTLESNVASAVVLVDPLPAPPDPEPVDDPACGCRSAGGPSWLWALLAFAVRRRPPG